MAETASGAIGGSQNELTEQASQNIAALHAEGDLSDSHYNRYLELKEAAEQSARAHCESIRAHEDVALLNFCKKRKMKYEVSMKKEEMQLANQSLLDHYHDCISVKSKVTTIRGGSGLPTSAALDGESRGEQADDAEQKQKGDNLNARAEKPSQAEFYRSRAPVADPQKPGRVDDAEQK
ncbi:hypothetical protein NLJ89_g3248 [Agrocybe chaxingu]|uniref:Uncharacterized protein n=1 Tax=Agrocybe chaxingu TaxID=84603 RepID=A0A9W8MX14_9AGAR|nr:hypothetical protein NLJ89_g3248 [Agrocybe chaxingu]